ncbi:MAG: ATP-binding protein, partial [Kofleriaceae bacterium]
MQRFQSELDRFAADAEQVLGTTPVVITLEETEWVCHLARLAEPVGAVGTWVPRIGPESNGTDVCDWFGELELGRGTPDHVFVRRVPWLGPYGEVEGSTLVAGITREAVDRVVTLGRSLWRDWRRREGGVRSPRGRHIDVDPVDWSDVVIPPSLLDDIRRNVLRFADAEPLYRRLRLPYRRGLLFYGAPGNGKTMLCRAIVTALGWPVIYVSPTSRGHAPDDLGAAFRQASELAPCVLWFDDVDCMFDTDATMSNFL